MLLTEAGAGNLPSGVAALAERLTRRRAEERPASAHEALRILEHARTTRAVPTEVTELLGESTDAGSERPVPDTYRPPSPPVRELYLTPRALAFGAAAIALVIIVLSVALGGDERDPADAPSRVAPPDAPLEAQLDSLTEQIRLLPSQ